MENIIDITGNEENNSEEEMSSPTTPRKLSIDNLETSSSFVWSHFIKDVNYKTNKKVTCNHCQKTYICSGGSTSGLAKHLKNVHNIVQDQNKPVEISVLDMLQAPRVNI